MANRHTHKKLRAEIRALMAAGGATHQQALRQALERRTAARRASEDQGPALFGTEYFGLPVTIAAYSVLSRTRLIVVSGFGGPLGLPLGNPSPIRVPNSEVQ